MIQNNLVVNFYKNAGTVYTTRIDSYLRIYTLFGFRSVTRYSLMFYYCVYNVRLYI